MFSLRRSCSLVLLVSLALLLMVRPATASVKLIAVFPLRSTAAAAPAALHIRQLLIAHLAALDGYDARAIDAPTSGSLGAAAAAIAAEFYVTGQVVAAEGGGYHVLAGAFETATDTALGRYDAITTVDALPDTPSVGALLASASATQNAALLGNPCPAQHSDTSGLSISVGNAWQSGGQGRFIVHDRVAITGGDVAKRVTACDFTLTVALLNGEQSTISGSPYPVGMVEHMISAGNSLIATSVASGAGSMIGVAAPAVPFLGPLAALGSSLFHQKVRPDVDPRDDLGGLGSVTVPPHESVTVVVTFAVNAYLADPNTPSTNVSLKGVPPPSPAPSAT